MKYILENSSLIYLLEELPRSVMPELWNQFEMECNAGNIISERETKKLVEMELSNIESLTWLENNKIIFKAINEKEAFELGEMVDKGLFNYYDNNPRLVERKLPEGVPFVLAIAKNQICYVVYRKHGRDSKSIFEICKKERINCIEVEELLLELKRKLNK